MFTALITEVVSMLGTIAAALVLRYLLGLSTCDKDKRWLKRQAWFCYLQRLEFYRGTEYLRQLQARKLLGEG